MFSDNGLAVLKELEGSEALPYQDSAGLWTIGVGHLLTKSELLSGKIRLSSFGLVEYGREPWPDEWVKTLLHDDLAGVETAIRRQVDVRLSQAQYDALCCWVFNVGVAAFAASTLLKRLNFYRYAEVPEQMRRWVYAGGKVIGGLKNRREREAMMWDGHY